MFLTRMLKGCTGTALKNTLHYRCTSQDLNQRLHRVQAIRLLTLHGAFWEGLDHSSQQLRSAFFSRLAVWVLQLQHLQAERTLAGQLGQDEARGRQGRDYGFWVVTVGHGLVTGREFISSL